MTPLVTYTQPLAFDALARSGAGRDALDAVGYWSDAGVIDFDWVAQLSTEAANQWHTGVETNCDVYGTFLDDRWFAGPMRFLSAAPGPWLTAVHTHPVVVHMASLLTGRVVAPTRTAYMYYTDGDFITLHTDVDECELTLLTAVLGDVPPLVVYPELRGLSVAQLLYLAETTGGEPIGGLSVPFAHGGIVALIGQRTPHRRPRVTTGGYVVGLATFCYR